MLSFSKPATAVARQAISRASTDHYLLGDNAALVKLVSELSAGDAPSKWAGGVNWYEALRMLETGDLSGVAKSDKYLSEVERLLPSPTAKHEIIDDVTGSVPNVPALLAGQPLTMRRKVKRENEAAPLAVVVDLGSSAGINVDDVARRGVAILALVRALTARRPVELWAGVTCQGETNTDSASCYFRIETAPMDLQRAAHWLTHPSVSRHCLYQVMKQRMHSPSGLPWAYGSMEKYPETFPGIIANAFPHFSDVFAIPGIALSDTIVADPIKWMEAKLAQYGDMESLAA